MSFTDCSVTPLKFHLSLEVGKVTKNCTPLVSRQFAIRERRMWWPSIRRRVDKLNRKKIGTWRK